MNASSSDLPKHKRIKHELLAELRSERYGPHDKFFSETELKQRYDASLPTIRAALKDLMAEGHIYREHGRGTYVSPKTARNKILIVGRFAVTKEVLDFGLQDFIKSYIGSTIDGIDRYVPVYLDSKNFLLVVDDLKHHYPELSGIIFFKDYTLLAEVKPTLDAADTPYLFYGSDLYKDLVPELPSICYCEKDIIEIGLDYLLPKRGERVGFVYSDRHVVLSRRKDLYVEAMRSRGLQPIPLHLEGMLSCQHEKNHATARRWLPSVAGQVDAFFCADDWLALFCQSAVVNAGIAIPDTLALLGITDYEFCKLVHPSLSSIRIPMFEDAKRCVASLLDRIENGTPCGQGYSSLQLVERMSS